MSLDTHVIYDRGLHVHRPAAVRHRTMASKLFGVSEVPIRQAINELRATTVAEPAINSVWREMNDQSCEVFVRDNLAVLWGYIDCVTA